MSAGGSCGGAVRVERRDDNAARVTGAMIRRDGSGISPLRPGGGCWPRDCFNNGRAHLGRVITCVIRGR